MQLFTSVILIASELNIFLTIFEKQKHANKHNRIQTNSSIMCGYFCIEFIDHILADKTLIDYTSMFLPHHCKKNDNIILKYGILKMNEEPSMYSNLSNQTQFRLNKINKILLQKFEKEK